MMQVRKEASLVVVIVVIAMVVVVDSVVVAGCRGCSSRGGVVLVMLFAECTRFTAEIRFFFPTCRHGLLLFWRVRLYSVRVVWTPFSEWSRKIE